MAFRTVADIYLVQTMSSPLEKQKISLDELHIEVVKSPLFDAFYVFRVPVSKYCIWQQFSSADQSSLGNSYD